jgi:hypothetical protein
MKKTMKKHPAKASAKRAVKDLDVKPAKEGRVRGGIGTVEWTYTKQKPSS